MADENTKVHKARIFYPDTGPVEVEGSRVVAFDLVTRQIAFLNQQQQIVQVAGLPIELILSGKEARRLPGPVGGLIVAGDVWPSPAMIREELKEIGIGAPDPLTMALASAVAVLTSPSVPAPAPAPARPAAAPAPEKPPRRR